MNVVTEPATVVAGLEVARAGAPGGFPVLLHHGLLGSATLNPDAVAAAAARGIELIAVARPGYGRSQPMSMRSVADWSDLVAPLLSSLGVQCYGVWGVSAGAPYSYALAEQDSRVRAVAITSGLGHVADDRVIAMYGPESREAFGYFRTADPDDVRHYWQQSLRTMLAEQVDGSAWTALLESSLAHECAGPGREAVLQQRPWGVDFGAIAAVVRLWHAPGDPMVPYATAQAMLAALPAGTQLLDQAAPDHVPTPATYCAALDFLATAR